MERYIDLSTFQDLILMASPGIIQAVIEETNQGHTFNVKQGGQIIGILVISPQGDLQIQHNQ